MPDITKLTEKPIAYLNTAGCGLISEASLATATKVYQDFTTNSSGRSEHWREKEIPAIRESVAAFMEVPADRIGFIPNFSYAMNALVMSLSGKERVLLYKTDYPSVYEPFVRNDFDLQWLPSPDGFSIQLSDIEAILSSGKIDILAISHVQWKTGFKLDLKKLAQICHQYGTALIMDVTQSLGACQLDIVSAEIDVVIASHYKWMNSGFGNGVIYFHPSFLQKYPQRVIGANSMEYENSARSFEPGGLNIYGLSLLQAAIEEKQQLGLAAIANHNMRLTQTLLNGLATLKDHLEIIGPYSIDERSSIVALVDQEKPGNGTLGQWLEDVRKIIVTRRDGTLRASMHFYNTPREVQSLLEALSTWVSLG